MSECFLERDRLLQRSLRKIRIRKGGQEHGDCSLVETTQTADGTDPLLSGRVDMVLPRLEGQSSGSDARGERDDLRQTILCQVQVSCPELLDPAQILKCSDNSAMAKTDSKGLNHFLELSVTKMGWRLSATAHRARKGLPAIWLPASGYRPGHGPARCGRPQVCRKAKPASKSVQY